ncbi:hypothetical protein IZ6_02900 [Terrihabitans soli]|uniref:Zinc finger/thioredoxin putative domain-containing protein n=1 Tax=Terrihabitans soli TaxID=708113 RepID=A0A6S6QP36_9HYPH|nr:zinc-ribbon domain-containing protein [Terrihabitans soli]BCJ89555.1 hypothetical protein IZ6_02900 [Terrihabitans soli]
MLIICPDCTTSYEVEPADLGPTGRKVRCTSCGSIWRAEPPEADPDEISFDSIDEAPDAHEAEPMLGPEDMAAPSRDITFDAMIGDDDATAEADEIEYIEDVESSAAAEPAPSKSRRRGRGTAPRSALALAHPSRLAFASALGLAFIFGAGIWRDTVVSYVPDLAGLYSLVGLPVNLRGLEFRDMETVETTDDGIPQLIVRGTIENVTEDKVAVPRLRLAVRGISGREIFVWTAVPAKPELNAGESLPFLAQLASPPAEGREIAVRFVSQRDGRQTVAVQ